MSTIPLVLPARTRTLCQVAAYWPNDDSGWTTIDAWAQSASIGMNNDVGSAQLYTPSGVAFKPKQTTSSLIFSQDYAGLYARICNRDPSGTIPDADGTYYSALWHGIVTKRGISSDGSGNAFVNTYSCAGILAILDSIIPQHHFYESALTDIAADVGDAPVFNYLGSKKTKNRSSTQYSFGASNAYVFSKSPGAEYWTALDVVNYYLALFAYFANAGPVFTIDGQTDALAWQEKWDLNGHSCGEAISRVMSAKQGIGYRCSVVAGDPVITVKSLSKVSITVPSTPFTPTFVLPASDAQQSVDLTSSAHIQSFNLTEDASSTVDELSVVMARPWYCVTLDLFAMFDIDWTPADQTTWETLDPLDTYGTLNTNFGVARVYRRFKLKSTWDGVCVGGFQLPTDRTRISSDLHGTNGLDGGSGVTDGDRPPGSFYTMTSELPCLDGYDWSTVDPATVDKTRRNAPSMAFVKNEDGTWSTLGESCSGGLSTMSVEVDSDLGAITFPDAAAETILAAMSDGIQIYVTVGMYGQFSDTVSWKRQWASQPRDQSRLFQKTRPQLMRKIIPKGSVVGVDETGALQTVPGDIVIHDDTALANNLLAMSRPWSTDNAWSIAYSKKGEIDPTYAYPGDLITNVSHFEGNGSVTNQAVLGAITSVNYDFAEPGEMSVVAKRIDIDVEAVL